MVMETLAGLLNLDTNRPEPKALRRMLAAVNLPRMGDWNQVYANMVREGYCKRIADRNFVRTLVIAVTGCYPYVADQKLVRMVGLAAGWSALLGGCTGIGQMVLAEKQGAPQYSDDPE